MRWSIGLLWLLACAGEEQEDTASGACTPGEYDCVTAASVRQCGPSGLWDLPREFLCPGPVGEAGCEIDDGEPVCR